MTSGHHNGRRQPPHGATWRTVLHLILALIAIVAAALPSLPVSTNGTLGVLAPATARAQVTADPVAVRVDGRVERQTMAGFGAVAAIRMLGTEDPLSPRL